MEPPVADQESFIARRQLFKNIWDQSIVNVDFGTAKSKVIKTLRLSDEKIANALKRKQEMKKLKSTCEKLLKLRDKQNAIGVTNDEQPGPSNKEIVPKRHVKRKKKIRILRMKRKIKKNTVLLFQHKSWKMKKTLPCRRNKSPTRISTSVPQYRIKRNKERKKIAKVTDIQNNTLQN